jgi:predicted CoA-binding protein
MTEREILQRYRMIAVVGLSNDTSRAAWSVSRDMQAFGFRIIPVHPDESEVLGEKVYPDLTSIPEPVEIVNLFRRSEHVPPFVEEAIAIKAKVVWMQSGIVNEAAAERARTAGLEVVQNSCIRTVYQRMRY